MMLTHKGTKQLETDRLILRRVRTDDAEPMFHNWANDPEVTRFLTWPPHGNLGITEKVIDSWISGYEQDSYYQWMITVKAEGDVPVGSITAVGLNEKMKSAEIGYCIGKKWWHRGIMSEALGAVIQFLFTEVGLRRIEAKHDPNNPHSGGVMRKCGMRYEGTTRKSDRNNLGICDMDHYAILREDYELPRHFMKGFIPKNDTELVQEFYSRMNEQCRLTHSNAASIEFLTTVSYIERYLKPGGKILDIGAGAGEYSLYFSRKGYSVSALELSESNLEAFRSRLTESDSVYPVQGNALDLSRYEDDSFDIVLLMGPLYHLHSEKDRKKCIYEAKRVCKPDGKIFFAFIENDIVILTMQKEHNDYLLEGDYNKDTFRLDDFPFVFHSVPIATELVQSCGLSIIHTVASDGLSELLAGFINRMDEKTFRQYLRYHSYICEKPECVGISNHLLLVAQK